MIKPKDILNIKEKLSKIDEPVLSLYLDINRVVPENTRDGYIIKAKDAMKEAGIPKYLNDNVVEKLQSITYEVKTHSIVIFITENMDDFSYTFEMNMKIPSYRGLDGVIVHRGRPYITPLLMTMDKFSRYGIIYLDRDHWRYFEYYSGKIEEVFNAFNEIDTTSWKKLTEDVVVSPNIPARGGAGKDKFERRIKSWEKRFYKDMAKLLENKLKQKDVKNIIFIGSLTIVREFERILPQYIRNKVSGIFSSPKNHNASKSEIFNVVNPVIEKIEAKEEEKLIENIREKGIWGYENVFGAIQEGRVYLWVISWNSENLDKTVYLCSKTGFVSPVKEEVSKICLNDAISQIKVGELIPDLALKYNMNLSLIHI